MDIKYIPWYLCIGTLKYYMTSKKQKIHGCSIFGSFIHLLHLAHGFAMQKPCLWMSKTLHWNAGKQHQPQHMHLHCFWLGMGVNTSMSDVLNMEGSMGGSWKTSTAHHTEVATVSLWNKGFQRIAIVYYMYLNLTQLQILVIYSTMIKITF
jgi:hypothetical protein